MTGTKRKMKIAGYCRISVDEELDKDNVSIENQKKIINDYINKIFPESEIVFYEDRDKSGYTFEQRSNYQTMRKKLLDNEYEILIVKDFSRFSRRNSQGLVELEVLRDSGLRIISIGDNVDYPTNDDWLMIQFRFLMNELPVTDTSKKVRAIVERKQKDGEWICNAPYGYYIHPLYKNKIFIDEQGAFVVKKIFELYNQGWGYKRIANYLTEQNCPTGRALMVKQLSERGHSQEKIKKLIRRTKDEWSHVSVSKIVTNDFYIGTLRQRVWKRKGINKADVRTDIKEHFVFENHHEAIIDTETFMLAQENYIHRSTTHYKGVRKYEHPYSGFLYCLDCGSPMFSIANPKRPAGYICGSYHRRGLKGCSSHHIHESTIDSAFKVYIETVMNSLQDALINFDMTKNKENAKKVADDYNIVANRLEQIKLELVECNRQRVKQILADRENEEILNESFDIMQKKITEEANMLKLQLSYLSTESEKRTKIKTNINSVLETLDNIVSNEHLSKEALSQIINKITIDEKKKIIIDLKGDIQDLIKILSYESKYSSSVAV